ncbi:hypothetical protein MMC17_004627 [Xylographa soralifera]|nr:hypothetical protein [Xylographa soralifera]
MSHNEAAHNETANNEAVQNETAHNETAHNETAPNETAPNETAPNETVHIETAHSETTNNEAPHNETAHSETTQNAPATTPRLHNKVALITGASSGLGRAIALAYASHGTKLVVCADLVPSARAEISSEATKSTHDLICELYGPDKAIFVECDVTMGAHVAEAVAAAVSAGGRLDIMVNNAGLGVTERDAVIHLLDEARWDQVLGVNLRGVFLGTKYAIAQFLRQEPLGGGQHRGWIVNLSSMLGSVGIVGGASAYCASKGAVLNLTKQVAVEYAKDRIHCNALCPGFTRTAMMKSLIESETAAPLLLGATPWGTWGQASDVANGAVFLASDDAAWITGIGLPIDGGFLAQ